MSANPSVIVHFRDCDQDDKIRESIDRHCERLAQEFHEVTRIEVSIEPNGAGFAAHGHVTGKGTDVAMQAEASEAGPAADRVFDKVERQLRKVHDKRIFAQRRGAQKAPAKREQGG
jgi:ribosomal subunit interface protein